MLPVTKNGIKTLVEVGVSMIRPDDEGCPACSSELLMGCCVECGEVYDPNP